MPETDATASGEVSELSHAELREEYEDLSERLFRGAQPADRRDELHNRKDECWREMKSRVDSEPPECPDCGEQNWAQNRGDAKRCCNCGKHLSIEDIELVEEIDDCWETVLAGGKADA